jgi:thiol:disulfide interchange protein DsbA
MRFIVILLLLLFFLPTQANEEKFIAGIHYEEIAKPIPKLGNKDIEILELFWYTCPHCYQFEQAAKDWKTTLPPNVEIRPYPAFNPRIEPLVRAFFVAQLAGLHEKTHLAIFKAIHEERKNLNSREALANFFADYGLSKADFDQLYDSFAAATELRRSARITRDSQLTGVPSLVVAGTYLVSTGSAISTYGEMFEVIEFLIEKSKKAAKP